MSNCLALLIATSLLYTASANPIRQGEPHKWDVTAAGAVGDGKMDCTAVFQSLLDAAGKSGGGVVEAPAGQYRIAGTLSIPANTTLQGIYRVPPTSGSKKILELTGSVLFAYSGRGSEQGPPFIRLAGSNSAVAGFIIAYPEWKQSDVPPIPYPPCILSQDTDNVSVRDCCLLNPYEGIKLVRAHRHLVRNVTGYPIKRGIFVDECYDIGHIENIHFWPFGVSYDPKDPYCLWINTKGVAFELARTDWHYVSNTFCFGYGIGYYFSESKEGSTNGNFLGLGADSCQRAVVVDQVQPPGLLITNGEFVGRWSSTDAVCVDIGPKVRGSVSLVNCSFWGPIDRCIWMKGAAGQLTVSACNFVHWDNRGVGSAAIQLDAGKSIVQGCTFGQDKLHVQAGPKVVSALLSTNQAEGGFRVENGAGARVQMALNQPDPVQWTPGARSNYRIRVGDTGDGRYLFDWHGQERAERTARWSQSISHIQLPVERGKPYKLTLEIHAPSQAITPEAGLYLDGKRIAQFKPGASTVTADVPTSTVDRVQLELRCAGWVPAKTTPGSNDQRTLGIQLYSITMTASGAKGRTFDANTGSWDGKTP